MYKEIQCGLVYNNNNNRNIETTKITNYRENVKQIILYPLKWTTIHQVIVIFLKTLKNSYNIKMGKQVRNKGADSMLDIISDVETKKQENFFFFNEKIRAGSLNLRVGTGF